MVGAEEVSLRIEAGTATSGNITNRDTPSANHATGIKSTQFCQNVYCKPGALFSVNRLSDAGAQITALSRLSHRPSDGLEFQNQLICGSPTDGAPPETGVYMHNLEMGVAQKWFSA